MYELDPQNDSAKYLLNSVNIMLQMINELPLEEVEDIPNVMEAQIASSVLIEVKKEILSEGWDVNSDTGYSFPQDINGYIAIPANVLDIASNDGNIIMRDWRLYDKKNQSPIFDEPQDMNVYWDLDFNSLAHPIRNLITIRAARKFQARTIMDTSVYGYSKEDEEDAYVIARRSDGFTTNPNMITSPYGQENLVMGR